MKNKDISYDILIRAINEKYEIIEMMRNTNYFDEIFSVADILISALKEEKKILLAGNGGSAADAQHFAAEIVGRYMLERKAMSAISLCTDPSAVTSIGNDYGFDYIFSRQIEGIGKPGDVFIGISTSGNSINILKGIQTAKMKGIKTIGLLGNDGGRIGKECENAIIVPSSKAARIQELHIFIIHILCELIEKELYN